MRRRAGYTLVEALVALLLLTVVLQAAWGVTAVHARAAYRLFKRAELLEASRVSGWVLREEMRSGAPGVDWFAGEDSISLRAFRALGTTCVSASEPGTLVVEVQGLRAADPSKDSVLVLWPDGQWRAHALLDRRMGMPCEGGDGVTERWQIDAPQAGGLLVRLYERGSYHVSDGAFRYRRGRSGRQPLTPRVLGPGSGLTVRGGSGVLILEPDRDPVRGWRVRQRLWARSP
jgi:hypothetical protein